MSDTSNGSAYSELRESQSQIRKRPQVHLSEVGGQVFAEHDVDSDFCHALHNSMRHNSSINICSLA